VGGLKEKLLAARRAGLATVLVPARNRPELAQLQANVTEGLELIEVETLDQVLERALVSPERIFGGEAFKPEVQPAMDGGRVWPQSTNTRQPMVSAGTEALSALQAA
jgi:ATP-dependent Lon protease